MKVYRSVWQEQSGVRLESYRGRPLRCGLFRSRGGSYGVEEGPSPCKAPTRSPSDHRPDWYDSFNVLAGGWPVPCGCSIDLDAVIIRACTLTNELRFRVSLCSSCRGNYVLGSSVRMSRPRSYHRHPEQKGNRGRIWYRCEKASTAEWPYLGRVAIIMMSVGASIDQGAVSLPFADR